MFAAFVPVLALAAALMAGGCALKTAPEASDKAETSQVTAPRANAAQARQMTSEGKSAQATPPPVTASSVAPGFPGCIDARKGLGEVKLGMTVEQVRRVAPWLDIDRLHSDRLSLDVHTLCGERVWGYTAAFDADCRVRSIWFTGPARLERIFRRICPNHEDPHGEETAFKWHCDSSGGRLSVTEHGEHLSIYRVLRLSPATTTGRCMLPGRWD